MDAQTLATLLLAELCRRDPHMASIAELAAACAADERAINAALALLRDLLLADEAEGVVTLRAASEAATRETVLIVENTPAVAHVAAALLESDGYGVLLAQAVPPALDALRCAAVSLVIVDSFASNASSAAERLRPLLLVAGRTPVLLFTAHRDLSLAEARAAGFAGLLPKPFDIDELLERVRTAIDEARAG
jgi:CheY-like chemotaxis protein